MKRPRLTSPPRKVLARGFNFAVGHIMVGKRSQWVILDVEPFWKPRQMKSGFTYNHRLTIARVARIPEGATTREWRWDKRQKRA